MTFLWHFWSNNHSKRRNCTHMQPFLSRFLAKVTCGTRTAVNTPQQLNILRHVTVSFLAFKDNMQFHHACLGQPFAMDWTCNKNKKYAGKQWQTLTTRNPFILTRSTSGGQTKNITGQHHDVHPCPVFRASVDKLTTVSGLQVQRTQNVSKYDIKTSRTQPPIQNCTFQNPTHPVSRRLLINKSLPVLEPKCIETCQNKVHQYPIGCHNLQNQKLHEITI